MNYRLKNKDIMKRIYIDNNILSKLLKDEKFSIKFRKKYPCDETLIYISTGTLLEQYKGKYYDRQSIIDLELTLLLHDSDVEKYENNRLDNFWDNEIIRKKRIKQFYYELDNIEKQNEVKYFDELVKRGLGELDIWRKDSITWRKKQARIIKEGSEEFKKNNFTNDKVIKPKTIVDILNIQYITKRNCKGLFTFEFLKVHRMLTLERKLELNDMYDVMQSIWYPYMDEIIIEHKQATYLQDMKQQEPLKSYFKNTKIQTMKTIFK